MTENEIAGVLKEYLEATLEPRIREEVKSGDIASQREFDASLATVVLRQLIEQWESDLKEKLGYSDMQETPRATERELEQEWAEEEDRIAHMIPEELKQNLAEFQDEHPEYAGMSVMDVFTKMREETNEQANMSAAELTRALEARVQGQLNVRSPKRHSGPTMTANGSG